MLLLYLLALVVVPLWQEAVPASANTWQGREHVVEEYLRTAKVTRIEELTIGVTRPQRAFLEPGGLADSFAWKKIPPGRHQGYWDSYKSDIAAYELDKLLGLGMVPVTVERRVQGDRGAAVLWLNGVLSWNDAQKMPKPASWARQIVRMKMFDNLIGNHDRNQGNLLVDRAGNLFLIDHSRAFINNRNLPQKLDHYDPGLWQRMLALDLATLKGKIGQYVAGDGALKDMLQRRDRMQKAIDELVAKTGEQAAIR